MDGRTRSYGNSREVSRGSLCPLGYLLLESGRAALWSVLSNEEPGSDHLEMTKLHGEEPTNPPRNPPTDPPRNPPTHLGTHPRTHLGTHQPT
ncbi:hypothetical protein Pcinc_030067 [Petrolisthes cinctipes]|uniref:Uncharacterized protein n=1 Tax=Petrolisthes cinctipes TaxID=88211 RepID=A0AAE1K346_PETCI|nr:hypothetical protein Pcinc_030067 [Petrolisthes cinctipes]